MTVRRTRHIWGIAAAVGLTVVLTACQQTPGTLVTKAGNGDSTVTDNVQAVEAGLGKPTSVAVDSNGYLYIAGVQCSPGQVPAQCQGQLRVVTIHGTIETLTQAQFTAAVTGLISDAAGNLTVAASGYGYTYVIGSNTDGSLSDIAGPFTSTDDDLPTLAQLPHGDLALTLPSENRVVRIAAGNHAVTALAGTGTAGFSGDGGPATAARLDRPMGIAAAPDGTVYIGEAGNERVRKVNPTTGVITTIAGTGNSSAGPLSGEGGPATAADLYGPWNLAVGADGSVFVSEAIGHVVRRISPSGDITTVIGTGAAGSSSSYGEGGPAVDARLGEPLGLAFDRVGNLLVADATIQRVLRAAPPFP